MNNAQAVVEINPQSKEIAIDLGVTDKAIAKLKTKYANLVISDTKTFESTKAARTAVVSVRTDIEKARKDAVKPFNKKVKAINAEAARLTELVLEVEDPLQTTVKAWEQKKADEKAARERAEAERVTKHKLIIDKINELGRLPFGATLDDIQQRLTSLNDIIVDDSLEEFELEAKTQKDGTLFILESALETAKEQAEAEAKRKEEEAKLAAERKQLAEKQAKLQAAKRELEEAEAAKQKAEEAKRKFFSDWDDALVENQAYDSAKEARQAEIEARKPDRDKMKKYFLKVYEFAAINAPELEFNENATMIERYLKGLSVSAEALK